MFRNITVPITTMYQNLKRVLSRCLKGRSIRSQLLKNYPYHRDPRVINAIYNHIFEYLELKSFRYETVVVNLHG